MAAFHLPWCLKTPLRATATIAITVAPFLIWWAAFWFVGFKFDIDCGQHLKRAADANSLEAAEKELAVVIAYAERNGLTEGHTTVLKFLWKRPVDDVGFWYQNLKSAHAECQRAISDQVSQDQKSVILLKLRQTLMDHGSQGGEQVTVPPGVARHPNNVAWCVSGWILGIIAAPGMLLAFIALCVAGKS